VTIEIPAVVPEGMVYVPAGRFLYGTGDEGMREFAQAQPLHPIELPGYFIGRHEVTFAEWIEFLSWLSDEERLRRMPSAADNIGSVQLKELAPGRWRLTLQAAPGGPKLSAMSGSHLRYPKRSRRDDQDWLRFPVIGISWDDILAYAAWLDRTGKVPGARPCTEHEWERAARGADDRRYPHGDVLGIDDANFDLTYGQKPEGFGPDAVGSHEATDSPFGVADLIGNAGEPARSVQSDKVVLCSGHFYTDKTTNQLTNRADVAADQRGVQNGARICANARRGEHPTEP
jgi:formylglycine-generating enzyme required for sulfatase activity